MNRKSKWNRSSHVITTSTHCGKNQIYVQKLDCWFKNCFKAKIWILRKNTVDEISNWMDKKNWILPQCVMYVQSDIETHLSLKQCVKLTFMAGARFSVRDKTDSHKSVKGSYSKKSLISKHCKAQVSSIENLLKDSFCILGNANALMISSCSFN